MRLVPPPSDEIDFLLWAGSRGRVLAREEPVRRWLARQEADARYLEAMRDALQSRVATATAPNNASPDHYEKWRAAYRAVLTPEQQKG